MWHCYVAVWNFFRPFLIFFRSNSYFCISIVVSLSLLLLIPQIKEVMLQTPELPRPWATDGGWGTMLINPASFVSFGFFVYLALLFAVGIAAILCVTPPKRTPPEESKNSEPPSPSEKQGGSSPRGSKEAGNSQDTMGDSVRRKIILGTTFVAAAAMALVWHLGFQSSPEQEGALMSSFIAAYAVALFAAGVASIIYLAPAPSITSWAPIPPHAALPSRKQWLALSTGLAVTYFLLVCGFPLAIMLVGLIVLWLPFAYWVVDRLCESLWALARLPLGKSEATLLGTPTEADSAPQQVIDRRMLFPRTRLVAALGAGLVGVVLIAVSKSIPPHFTPWPMADYFLTVLGFLSLGLAGCYLLGRVVRLWAQAPRSHRAAGRILGWLLFSFVFGELFWAMAHFESTRWLISYRLYTIWAVLRVVVLVVLVTSLFDTLDEETAPPWRILGLILAALVTLSSRVPRPETLPAPQVPASTKLAKPADWAHHLKQRIHAIPKMKDKDGNERDGPVVLVAASGGGSRAAIFAGLVLEALARETFCENAQTKWGDHIVLISGVSGGSLGSAHYLSSRSRPSAGRSMNLRNSIPLELANRLHKATKEILQARRENQNGSDKQQIGEAAEKTKRLVEAAEKTKRFSKWYLDRALAPTSAKTESSAGAEQAAELRELEWVVQSSIMDDLCTDFMAPVLRGILTPGTSRGQALRRFWTERFGWGTNLDQTGYAGEEDQPSFDPQKHPLAIFNSCDVRRGGRIAIGFPPLPPGFFGSATAEEEGERPHYPPASLADLDDQRAIYLADAVGLSANFPFGFNVISFDRRLGAHQKKEEEELRQRDDLTVKILDGGIVDNTGIDSLYLTLEAIRTRALQSSGNDNLALYREIWEELLKRRVYLIEIDSGAKPEKPGPATRILSVLLDPLGAMNNANFTNADRAKRHYYRDLGDLLSQPVDLSPVLQKLSKDVTKLTPTEMAVYRELSNRQATGVRRFSQVVFDANHFEGENVPTAWSLAPAHKAMLVARFLVELNYIKPELKKLVELAWEDESVDRCAVYCSAERQVAQVLGNRPQLRLSQSLQELTYAMEQFNKKKQNGYSRELFTILDQVEGSLRETEVWAEQANLRDPETAAKLTELKKTIEKNRQELREAEGKGSATAKVSSFTIEPAGKLQQVMGTLQQEEHNLKNKLEQMKIAGPTQELQEELTRSAAERRKAFDQPKK